MTKRCSDDSGGRAYSDEEETQNAQTKQTPKNERGEQLGSPLPTRDGGGRRKKNAKGEDKVQAVNGRVVGDGKTFYNPLCENDDEPDQRGWYEPIKVLGEDRRRMALKFDIDTEDARKTAEDASMAADSIVSAATVEEYANRKEKEVIP